MDNGILISAVPASLIITILTQIVKRCGLPSKYAPAVAILLGISYTGLAYAVRLIPGLRGGYEALGAGLTLGLTSCGLYSSGKAMIGRSPLGSSTRRRATVTRDVPAIVEGSAVPSAKEAGGNG